jgi:type IV pilus biogenesis protein CpaD/CtpE
MSFHLRPVTLIAVGIVALTAGCAATEPAPAPKGIVLNPPAPERPRRVAAKPRAPAPAPDETGLTQAQKEELFERFVETHAREAQQ